MAIDFQNEQKSNPNIAKIIILVVVLVLAVFIFIFFKNGGFGSDMTEEQNQLFEPINIDFELLSSEKFRNLENLTGILVLPGFIDASISKTEAELIEAGRKNPFSEVSMEEIDYAVIKVIEKMETIAELDQMKETIIKSNLYIESEKQTFFNKIEERKTFLQVVPEEVIPEGEVILPGEEVVVEEEVIIEEGETASPEEEDYYKEW